MKCYRDGGCGPYEMYSCADCPASRPEYAEKNKAATAQSVGAAKLPPGVEEALETKANHMRDLLKAEREGRLVVFPCKVGDFVWALWSVPTEYKYVIYFAEVKEIWLSVRNCRLTVTYRIEPVEFRGRRKEYRGDDFGKLVFLTLEEAESALRGDDDES